MKILEMNGEYAVFYKLCNYNFKQQLNSVYYSISTDCWCVSFASKNLFASDQKIYSLVQLDMMTALSNMNFYGAEDTPFHGNACMCNIRESDNSDNKPDFSITLLHTRLSHNNQSNVPVSHY